VPGKPTEMEKLLERLDFFESELRRLETENRALSGKCSLLEKQNILLRSENRRLSREILLARQDKAYLLRKLFGKGSERRDPAQLDLFAGKEETFLPPAGGAERKPGKAKAKRKPAGKKAVDLSALRVEETRLVPEEVTENPDAYRKIGEQKADVLDYRPSEIFLSRFIRETYVPRSDPDAAPLRVPAREQAAGNLLVSAALIAHILTMRYCEHMPFHRQSKRFERSGGVRIGTGRMCSMRDKAAARLAPLYELTVANIFSRHYVQIDETTARCLGPPGTGGSKTGYFWLAHAPEWKEKPPDFPDARAVRTGEAAYFWFPSRSTECLREIVPDSPEGHVIQCDGYNAYTALAAERSGIVLAACWAHVRRKFFDAEKAGQLQATAVLEKIGLLYRIEKELRRENATDARRAEVRGRESRPVAESLGEQLVELRAEPGVLPKSRLGKAIDYTLGVWERLLVHIYRGEVEIDNNLVENEARPVAVGRKNWLFIGNETKGRNSAIILTLIENARRFGLDPHEYLRDVLERMPQARTREERLALLPRNWKPAAKPEAAVSAAAR
jgi:transposase